MTLFEILQMRGFDLASTSKLLRHQDQQYDGHALARAGHLEPYQSVQGGHYLNCDYIIAFLGAEGSKAVFAGIWKVIRRLEKPFSPYVDMFPFPELMEREGDTYYEFSELPGFDDLKGRLVIDWGRGTRAWHQWLRDKPVLELAPVGQVSPFPGYLDFVLSFEELGDMIRHPDANRVWHQMLSAVAGIYLITDRLTGQLYVGSAYGKDGILGRWKTYVQSGHGGNVELKRLLDAEGSRVEDLAFTLLRTLPRTLTQKEVVGTEQLYKYKLGSRVHGLNRN